VFSPPFVTTGGVAPSLTINWKTSGRE
jgi:hypothetical protein